MRSDHQGLLNAFLCHSITKEAMCCVHTQPTRAQSQQTCGSHSVTDPQCTGFLEHPLLAWNRSAERTVRGGHERTSPLSFLAAEVLGERRQVGGDQPARRLPGSWRCSERTQDARAAHTPPQTWTRLKAPQRLRPEDTGCSAASTEGLCLSESPFSFRVQRHHLPLRGNGTSMSWVSLRRRR